MARHCLTARRCLWLAVPIVGAHLGCLALPAATLALGAPALMPICGEAPGSWRSGLELRTPMPRAEP